MTKPDWQQVKDFFAEAKEQPADVRLEFLKAKCKGDDLLFNEVSSLLAASVDPDNLIENNAIDLASKVGLEVDSYREQHFGNFRILREIGSGGMGTVFLAERDDGEFTMQVALKIVRQSVADREIITRFKRERQILANLNHPNIAVLHDGGVTEKGEPYLAMEFVDGKSLIEYAEENRLPVEDKLRLFVKVCSAVAYAHRNLVVHRDIKPSNILVTPEGEPKLLDFGLAKALETDAAQTQTALRAFTPAYASPEQILGGGITTASDIYSLGVVFYELLSGDKPFNFEGKSLDEIARTIATSQPALPSANLNETKRVPQLKGDLDNIALTALRKEPERRFKTVEDFAEDIERHLSGRPISARPITTSYLAGKFIRRNKIAVTAGLLVLISLLAGIGISIWQARIARREAARSEAVSRFLGRMLATAMPEGAVGRAKGAQVTIVDVLNEAERRLDGEDLSSQPEVRAELRRLIGAGYLAQGLYDQAGRNLTRAFEELSALYGRESPRTLIAELDLASFHLAKADYDWAWDVYQRRFEELRDGIKNQRLDPEYYLGRLSDYAVLSRARGDADRAEALLREAVEYATKLSLPGSKNSAVGLLTLILLDQGRIEEARSSQLALVSRLRQSEPVDSPAMPPALTLLGSILMENGEFNDAQSNLIEAEAIYRKHYGPEFIAVFDNLRLQAQVAYLSGDYSAAEKKIGIVLEAYRKISNPKYISFATALTIEGLLLNKLGKRDNAESVLREAVRLRNENLPPTHFMTALTKGALGEVLLDGKKYAEAETYLRESFASLSVSQKKENARLKLARERLSRLESAMGKSSS